MTLSDVLNLPSLAKAVVVAASECTDAKVNWVDVYGGFFNLTLHPQFVGRPGRLQALERFLQTLSTYRDVWTAPLRDVARYWREEHS